MSSWDGTRSVRLTRTAEQEHTPRWSPDGRYLAFLSSRDDPREVDQVWLLDRSGGEAERVTDLPGGVSDYAWSPDGSRLALIAADPDRATRSSPGQDTTQEAAPADRDRPVPVQVRRGRLHRRRARPPATSSPWPAARRTLLTPGEYDEAGAGLVARRTVDRVPEPASAGVRPHRQLGRLRRRSRAPAPSRGSSPRSTGRGHGSRRGAAARRAGVPTGSTSRTSRAAGRSCSTTAGRRSRWCRWPAGRPGC